VTKVGERIAALRDEVSRVRGIPLYNKDVAKLVGVTPQQVSNWMLGRREVDSRELSALADVFSRMLGRVVTVDYILGREEVSTPTQKSEAAPRMYPVGLTQKVPVFAKFPTAEPPQKVGEEEVTVTDLRQCSGQVFFLTVNDDSMAGVGVHQGHRVLIDTEAPYGDGDIVLVAVVGEEFASLRQVYREGDDVLLLPRGANGNLKHKPTDVRVLGKMMWGRYYPNKG
jgi:SOS-response transcriptional repressor LexA